MEIKDVIEFIEDNKDNDEVKEYLSAFRVKEDVSLDTIKQLVEEDTSVKSWFDSNKDSHANKSLETWKSNHLSKLVDDEIASRLPKEEQENLKLRGLEQKIEQMEKEANHKDQSNLALRTAQSKGLPVDLAGFFIGNTDEETKANIDILESAYKEHLEIDVKSRLKDTSYTPPKNTGAKEFTTADLGSMTDAEINKFYEDQLSK